MSLGIIRRSVGKIASTQWVGRDPLRRFVFSGGGPDLPPTVVFAGSNEESFTPSRGKYSCRRRRLVSRQSSPAVCVCGCGGGSSLLFGGGFIVVLLWSILVVLAGTLFRIRIRSDYLSRSSHSWERDLID